VRIGRRRVGGEEEPCQYDIFGIRDQFANQLPETPEEQIDIRMRRNNFRVSGGFRNLNSAIPQADFYVDFTDYQHEEIETEDGIDEVATTFWNDTLTYRGVFQQAKYKKLTGRFGFEGFRRSYLTEGAESLVEGRVRQKQFLVLRARRTRFRPRIFAIRRARRDESLSSDESDLSGTRFYRVFRRNRSAFPPLGRRVVRH
jgi:hypothetical protein